MNPPLSAETVGYGFAFARSLTMFQAAGHTGDWFAPGWNPNSKFEEMPGRGSCECGQTFSVSDVYHYSATCDGMWHTRYACKPLPKQTP